MSPELIEFFEQYANDHKSPINRLTHKIAIPMIVFHIVVMLSWVKLFTIESMNGIHVSAAHIFLLCVYLYYFSLSRMLSILMIIVTLPLLWIADYFSVWFVWGVAIFSWAIQLAGHYIWEKNSPSFMKNMLQALIGPLFFLAIICGVYKPPSSKS